MTQNGFVASPIYGLYKQKYRLSTVFGVADQGLAPRSLDELPQLWNVLKGEMSLVGPHPILISQRKLYGDTYQEYVRVLPGITGLWQVSGRNDTAFARRAELDHEYIRCRSIGLDIYILFKTIEIILWRQGAY